MLSTSHYNFDVHGEDKKMKPSMIVDYNKTKGGTDAMDQMLGNYTSHRKTRRWTEAVFYNLIDVAGLASFIIYKENTKDLKLERRKFLKALAIQMCMPEILRRAQVPNITGHFVVKTAIEAILGAPLSEFLESQIPPKDIVENKKVYNRCYACKKTTRTKCTMCDNGVCKTHHTKVIVCGNCNYVDNL